MYTVLHASLLLALAVPSTALAGEYRYLVLGNEGSHSKAMQQAEALGATVTEEFDQIGVFVVESADPDLADALQGASGVVGAVLDAEFEFVDDDYLEDESISDEDAGYDALSPPFTQNNDTLYNAQWGHDAMDVPEAWEETGLTGEGILVAILDTGIDRDHPDLAANLDTALSTSFVPGQNYYVREGNFFSHGSHVAGIVAAPDNARGTIGVAPKARIMAVKVLSEFTGSGSFSWLIQGMLYATDNGADIINMSLGGSLSRSGNVDVNGRHVPASGASHFITAVNRAVAYAAKEGVVVVVSAGNGAVDANHDDNQWILPAMSPDALTISSTRPIGWAIDPATDLDVPATYTNFGTSLVSHAAPGGGQDAALVASGRTCRVSFSAVTNRPCWVYDYVIAPGAATGTNGLWFWAAGTSMAAPHVSGVVALMLQGDPSLTPAQVKAKLRQSADDLGKSGNDDYYGHGRVNAAAAVGD